MSDRSNAQILIGGSLSVDRLEDLSNAIQAADLGPAWDEPFDERDEIIHAIRETAERKAPLLLQRIEVPGGAFEALETFCREMNLPYRRSDDGHYSYEAEVVLWQPELAAPVTWTGSLDHRPRVTVDQIREAYEVGALPTFLTLMSRADQFDTALVLVPTNSTPDTPA